MSEAVAILRPLRPLLTLWHKAWAATPTGARAYARMLVASRPLIPRRVGSMLLANLGTTRWPAVSLPAVAVRVGPESVIRLHPHFGEFDVEALLRTELTYEAEVFRWLDRRAAMYDTVVEIGANVGVFTAYFASAFTRPDGTPTAVLAFEPSPEAARRLRLNLAANNLTRVDVYVAAVSDVSGSVTFHEPDGHLTNGSLDSGFARQFSSTVSVREVRSFNGSDVEGLVPPGRTLLKIDVEGAEPLVLASLNTWLKRSRPDMLIEVLPGQENAITKSLPPDLYRAFEITDHGAVAREVVSAGACRDWWFEPVSR